MDWAEDSQDVTSVARRWESLRGRRARGEVGEDVYLRQCEELADFLRVGSESGDDAGVGVSAGADELAYRIDLLRLFEREARGDGLSHVLSLLPRLWQLHRRDPMRFPAHPDAVGGAEGQAMDGGQLPNVFVLVWQDVILNAALSPAVTATQLEELNAQAFDALAALGLPEDEVSELRVRVRLATGDFDGAQALIRMLDAPSLPDAPDWDDAYRFQRDMDVRAMTALQCGDLEGAAALVDEMVAAPETRSQPTVMVAESLIPLAGILPPETSASRACFVADRAAGEPMMSDAMLQVAEFLAQTGRERQALGLVDRLLPLMGLDRREPEGDVHLLAGMHTVYKAAADAGFGEVRPLFASLPSVSHWVARIGWDAEGAGTASGAAPTVAQLAAWTGQTAREAAAALDLRNDNDSESTIGLGLHVMPEGASVDTLSDAAETRLNSPVISAIPPMPPRLPGWIEHDQLELPPEVADFSGELSGRPTPEVPVAGPVDVAGLGTEDALLATMLYSTLGLVEAVSVGVDRLVELRDNGGDGEYSALLSELVNRYERAVTAFVDSEGDDDDDDRDDSDGDGDADPERPTDPVIVEIDNVLSLRQEAQDEAEDAGAPPVEILTNRVNAIAGEWEGSCRLVREIIEQDILMGGVFPDLHALSLGLRALRRVTRFAPRAVPQVGTGLMVGIAQLDATATEALNAVAQYTTAVALVLPPVPEEAPVPDDPPAAAQRAGEDAPDLQDDLAQLGIAMAGSGVYFEALCVYDRALDLLEQVQEESPGAVEGGASTDADGMDGMDAMDAIAAEDDIHSRRVRLISSRGDTLSALGNHRVAAETHSEAAATAEHWGLWEYAAESQVRCAAACLDDRDFPRAAMIIEGFDEVEGLDWMRFPSTRFRRELQATRLATALTADHFEAEWAAQRARLAEAHEYLAQATSPQRAASELVDGVLLINRGLVHAERVDVALELTGWAAGEAKAAETAVGGAGASGGPGEPDSDGEPSRPAKPVGAARLEALTEEALLLHVQGRDDAAMMIFESVVQQARRADTPWLVDAVSHRMAAASRYAEDEQVRRRYADLMRELALD
ncbi:MAG TPA: hypothetical protein H9870_09650 [Candidatus Corynebacterium avicola]|uniref:Tetratricopeptide repeat protein n=1 Tax=Candidatus Corynebacterium avicola TaxID=2838527 RepID=A0A9D1RQW7_9CORY|nr:hypothetical protein [Candidatus Corynebacterium avicola]